MAAWYRWGSIVAAFLGLAVGCSADKSATETARATAKALAPVDLAGVMRRVHFAFRPEGDAFAGGHDTYAVRVDSALHVTPGPASPTHPAAAFTATVAAVDRGGATVVRSTAARPRIEEDGRVAIARGGVVERLENGERGVEQSFHFADRPAGSGDLVVHLAVSGESFAGETATGLHFVDPATGFGVRYGDAAWVDARGRRTALQVTREPGGLAVAVPAAVVDESAFPAVLDPMVGPELGSDNPVPIGANATQQQTRAAFGTSSTLVVWEDTRNGVSDIYAARVSPAGALLDVSNIPVSIAANLQENPWVAFDGTNWLVVWEDYRNNANGDIYGARVTTAGVVLDPTGYAIFTGASFHFPSVACQAGVNCLVVAGSVQSSTTSYGTLVAPNGTVLSPAPFEITTSFDGYYSAVSYNAPNYLVAVARSTGTIPGVVFRRVSGAGAVIDASDVTINTTAWPNVPPAVATDGTNWMILWNTNGTGNVLGALVTGAGALVNASGFDVGNVASPAYLDLGFTGNQYHAFYRNSAAELQETPVSLGGVPGATVDLASAVGASYGGVSAAFDGTNYFVAYDNAVAFNNNPRDVFGNRFSVAGVNQDPAPLLVSLGANAQQNAAVGYNGTNYLAVWEDFRNQTANTDLWATRVSTTGTILDPNGIEISGAINVQQLATVASNGTDWFVAWNDSRAGSGLDAIYGTRVTAAGAVVDAQGILINDVTQPLAQPAATSDGVDYLVAYQTNGSSYAARVTDAAGTVLDPNGIYACSGTAPAAAYNGTDYLVACATGTKVLAARLSPAGTLLDPAGFTVFSSPSGQLNPTVASDGNNWLVAWFSTSGGATAARVSPAGTVLDALGFSVFIPDNNPRSTFDGTDFWIASANGTGIELSPVSSAGTALGTIAVPQNASEGALMKPSVVAGPPGNLLLAYHASQPLAPDEDTSRVFMRIVGNQQSTGGACTVAAGCSTGFCVDGFCCNSACTGACQGCSAALTGGASGTCGDVLNGTNPNMGCPATGVACANATCENGACTDQVTAGSCFVGGACYAMGAQNPGDVCEVCAPATSQTAFSNAPDGTACTSDGLACTTDACASGACTHALQAGECLIGGVCEANGAMNPLDACQVCTPSSSTSAWSSVPDGTACASDGLSCTTDACTGGSCTHALQAGYCIIAGSCVTAGTANPLNACQSCQPAMSTMAWSSSPDGTACTSDGIACTVDACMGGACAHTIQPLTCLIAGTCVAEGTQNPVDDCQSCQSAMSTSMWSTKPDGATCTSNGLSCESALCMAGACTHPQDAGTCLIAGVCYMAGATDPAETCMVCLPGTDPTGWTPTGACMDAGSGSSTSSSSSSSGTSSSTSSSSTSSSSSGTTTSSSSSGAGGAGSTSSSGSSTSSGGAGGGGPSSSSGGAGGAGTSSSGAGAGGSSSSGSAGSKGGCSCRLEGSSESPQGVPFAAVAAVMAVGLRRARRRGAASAARGRDR